ncbi:hypothetical protein, partial [Endozoicomonas sp. ONNA2]|uniref:hypothetical protein n=1 Tax=Endozoicomonas sp. ONNA2 TaxID=2828741 RepID=UPI002148BC53
MAKFPALPATVDLYVHEFLNKLVGRSSKAGDRVAMISDFTDLGLAKEKGQRLSLPASAVGSVTEILEPDTAVELPDNPQNVAGFSAAGVFGAVILDWETPACRGHNHTEGKRGSGKRGSKTGVTKTVVRSFLLRRKRGGNIRSAPHCKKKFSIMTVMLPF